jgi:hypothetical protein
MGTSIELATAWTIASLCIHHRATDFCSSHEID